MNEPHARAARRLEEDELRQGLTALCAELAENHPSSAAALLARLEEGAGRPGAAAVGDAAAAAVLRLHMQLKPERGDR